MSKSKTFLAPLAGPLLFLLFLNLDFGLETNQSHFLAIFIFTVYNWLIAWLPLYVTGFIGVSLASLFGIAPASELLASFAHPIVFLFLAGFLFAKSMSETGLDKRVSLFILSRKAVNKSFDRLLFALLGLSAFFSLWVSNTATTAMMLPIVLGIAKSLDLRDDRTVAFMLLGLAYSSSVGGIGSPVGSTPNIIVIGMLEELAGIRISFFHWLLFGVPLASIFVFIIYLYIKKQIPLSEKKVDVEFLEAEAKKLPPINTSEKWLVGLFLSLVLCWFAPGFLAEIFGRAVPFFKVLSSRMDPGITGILLASMLFIFPFQSKSKLLAPGDIKDVDWPSLLLFGSGLALGKTLFSTGLAQIAGDFLVQNIAGSNFFVLILMLSFFTIFSTELASNTATANILLPIVIAAAAPLGVSPVLTAIAVALSCSLAFMLPVATPPNAIVYGCGKIEIPMMVRFGILLNVIFACLIAIVFYFLKFLI